jgi:hypothetical protein
MPRLLSVNVGLPRDIAWRGETVRTAVSYQPEPLERPADGTLLICCSQPRDEVILDL